MTLLLRWRDLGSVVVLIVLLVLLVGLLVVVVSGNFAFCRLFFMPVQLLTQNIYMCDQPRFTGMDNFPLNTIVRWIGSRRDTIIMYIPTK